MNLDEEWEKFSKSSTKSKQYSFAEYCFKNIEANDSGELTTRQAAYNICAACIHIRDKDSGNIKNFKEIENIACDLELPEEHRSISLDEWETLKKLIKNIW